MRFRTAEQVHDFLDADLIWRKRELTQYRFLLEDSLKREERGYALLRGCVTLLYAHWEGYVKAASSVYIEYLAGQRLRYEQLAPNILALACRSLLRGASEAKSIRAHIDVTRFFRAEQSQESKIPIRDAISTRSNLTSKTLFDILDVVGIDPSGFESKAHLIDERLVRSRNTIAHGEFMVVTPDAYEELYREVMALLEIFRTELSNNLSLKRYLAA